MAFGWKIDQVCKKLVLLMGSDVTCIELFSSFLRINFILIIRKSTDIKIVSYSEYGCYFPPSFDVQY